MEKVLIKTNERTNKDIADLLKFVMSLLVVATHTELLSGGLYPLTRLAVPVFFMLSSYFFSLKEISLALKSEKLNYLKAWTKRILIMYGFWFVVLSPLTFYIRQYHKLGVLGGAAEIVKDFLLSSTFQGSWFLAALVIGNAVVFALSKKCKGYLIAVVSVLCFLLALLSSNYHFIVESSEGLKSAYNSFVSVFSLPCRNFFVSFIYIFLGRILARIDKVKIKPLIIFILSALSIVFLYLEAKLIDMLSVTVYDNDCLITILPCAFLLCLLALKSGARIKFAKTMRNISIFIYCVHMPVYMVIGKLFKIFQISDYQNILVFALTALISVFVGVVVLRFEKIKAFAFLKYSH